MAITVADLDIRARADTSSAEAGMARLNNSVEQAPGFFNRAGAAALGFIAANVGIQAVGAAWDFAKSSIIGFNAMMEQSTIGFTTMLGSGEKAKSFLDDLKSFGATTPFRVEGLVSSSQRLLAMGFTAEEIIPTLTSVGDAVAALGQGDAGIDRATYALGQMKSAGRVMTQDLMQLTNLGIPAWEILAKHAGVSVGEMRDMVSDGLVDSTTGVEAIIAGMDARFGGLMKEQAFTFNGAMSAIKDTAQIGIADAFKPLFDWSSLVLQSLAAWMTSPAFGVFTDNVATGMAKAFAAIGLFVGAVRGGIRMVSAWLSGGVSAVSEYFGGYTKWIALFQGQAAAFIANIRWIGDAAVSVFDMIRNGASIGDVAEAYGATWEQVKFNISASFSGMVLAAKGGFATMSADAAAWATGMIAQAQVWLGGVATWIAGTGLISEGMVAGATAVGDYFGQFSQWIQAFQGQAQAFIGNFDWIAAAAVGAFDMIRNGASIGDVAAAYGASWEHVKNNLAGAFDSMVWIAKGGFGIMVADAQAWATGMAAPAQTWLAGLGITAEGMAVWVGGMIEKSNELKVQVIEAMARAGEALVNWIAPMIPLALTALSEFGQGIFTWALGYAPVLLAQFMAWGTSLVDWILPMVGPAITALTAWAQSMFDWLINTGVPQAAAALGPMALAFVDWVFAMLPKLLDALDDIILAILGFIVTNGPVLIGKLLEWGLAFVGWIATEVIPRLIANLPTILRVIMLFLGSAAVALIGKAGSMGLGLVSKFIAFIATLPGKFAGYVTTLLGQFVAWGGRLLGAGGTAASSFVAKIISFITQLPGKVMGFFATLLGRVSTWFAGLKTSAGSWASGVIAHIVRFFGTLPGKAITAIQNLVTGLRVFIAGIPGRIANTLGNAGSSIVTGLWNGIKGATDWIMGKVSGFIGGVVSSALDFLGISSPSKVFANIGKQVVAGLGMGIERNSGLASKAVQAMVGDVTGAGMTAPRLAVTGATTQNLVHSVLGGVAAPVYSGSGGGATVILQADRFMGSADEGRYYSDLIARQLRLQGA